MTFKWLLPSSCEFLRIIFGGPLILMVLLELKLKLPLTISDSNWLFLKLSDCFRLIEVLLDVPPVAPLVLILALESTWKSCPPQTLLESYQQILGPSDMSIDPLKAKKKVCVEGGGGWKPILLYGSGPNPWFLSSLSFLTLTWPGPGPELDNISLIGYYVFWLVIVSSDWLLCPLLNEQKIIMYVIMSSD